MWKETEAEIRKLTEQLYRMQSAWTQAGESLTAISKKCETISKTMTKAGKSLTTHVTAPITALGTAAVKASMKTGLFHWHRMMITGPQALIDGHLYWHMNTLN